MKIQTMSSYIDIEDASGSFHSGETPIIKVMGVGGGGSNAVNHMAKIGIKNVEFIICNTDIQALRESPIKNRIQIGKDLTEGLGAGCLPEKGKCAILESAEDIRTLLENNTKVLFITAGMGGGTGTGAAPQIAKIAHEMGILTIGIVSVPFEFEGEKKLRQAMEGIDELEHYVDTISIIVNDRLLDDSYSVPLSQAFAMADNVLAMAAKSIADVIMMPGYINIDLRDVCTVMRDKGVALIGSGVGEGPNRAIDAVQAALYSPLLKDQDIKGAAYVLIHIQYGPDEVTIQEHDEITDYVLSKVGQLTNVIWGTAQDDELGDKLRVSVVATGFNRSSINEVRKQSGGERQPRLLKVERRSPQVEPETEFNVVPKQEELTMHIEDTAQIEAKAREQRERKEREQAERERALREKIEQEQNKKQSNERDFQLDDDDFEEPKVEHSGKSITSAEAVDKWFKNKLGGGEGIDFELD